MVRKKTKRGWERRRRRRGIVVREKMREKFLLREREQGREREKELLF